MLKIALRESNIELARTEKMVVINGDRGLYAQVFPDNVFMLSR